MPPRLSDLDGSISFSLLLLLLSLQCALFFVVYCKWRRFCATDTDDQTNEYIFIWLILKHKYFLLFGCCLCCYCWFLFVIFCFIHWHSQACVLHVRIDTHTQMEMNSNSLQSSSISDFRLAVNFFSFFSLSTAKAIPILDFCCYSYGCCFRWLSISKSQIFYTFSPFDVICVNK